MTFWDKLDAKQRRRLTAPIKISDSSQDEEILMGAQVAFQQAIGREDANPDEVKVLEAKIEEAAAALRAHWTEIELQSLPADEWNAAMLAYRAGEDGEVDWAEALAPLLTMSCVDPEGQDAERWKTTLERPEWSEGDRDVLRRSLLQLNVIAADPYFPKG